MEDGASSRFWRGAARGLAAVLLAFVAVTAYARIAPPTPGLGSFLAILKLLSQMVLAGVAALVGIRLLQRVPSVYLWVLACTLAFLYYHFGRFEPWGLFWVAFFTTIPASLLGGSLAARPTWRPWVVRVVWGVGALGLVWALFYFFRAGFPLEPPPNAAKLSGADIGHIVLPDPALRGDYPVAVLHYGSGTDLHRAEFGRNTDLVTEPVDGSAFIEGWEDLSGWARTRYWGFDAEHLPLQGRVWYPEGDGPFPLVLIVHGNHAMEDFSDPGYAYLGELLASRGIIVVSVDENFINSSFSGRLDELRGRGLETENDARGWLLLQHLKQWRQWSQSEVSPFYRRVDMERIGLVGHSRGGEAVAVAAAFNRLPRYPDDASVTFDFGFSIRGIVAIAPVDGQYKPSGRGTPLEDLDYFVLHGSHDGDVQSFAGSRQFERVELGEETFHFKSSLYVYGANHGQFNTTWGRTDSSFPTKQFLNLVPILPEGEQRRIAEVFISAFFEISLNGERGYLPLFGDARTARHWLPDTIYLSHYRDSTFRTVSDFDEDLDLTTTTVVGGRLQGEGLSVWKETLVELKHGDKGTSAVHLGWNQEESDEIPSYGAILPETIAVGSDDALFFALADAREPDASSPLEPIDLTVEVEDASEVTARLPLSDFTLVQPRIDVQVRKSDLFNRTSTTEPVFQSFFFPLSSFSEAESQFDSTRLREIRFVFDRSEEGELLMDGIGFGTSSLFAPSVAAE